MFITKVRETIISHALFDDNATVLVALSGGADSVALARVLTESGYACKALHCNFHLRGDESDRDEKFVRELCARLGIQCLVRHFDTAAYSRQHGVSIEMAARDQRYQWFAQCIDDKMGDVVAVAHNADDNVETFLINMTRGSGIKGLSGIPIRNGAIVRPLLNVSRKEITDYLAQLNQDFVTDSTNLEDEFTRNKFRLNIIPLLEQINPSFKSTIAQTTERLREVASLAACAINEKTARIMQGNRIDIDMLKKEEAQTTLLYEMLHPLGFNTSQVNDIRKAIDAQPGKTFVSGTYCVTRDRKEFIISETAGDNEGTVTLHEGTNRLAHGSVRVSRCTAKEALNNAKADKGTAYVDTKAVKGKLTVRKWQKGDWFIPYGMRGRKNISDFLTDLKRDAEYKRNTLVVTDDRSIIWVVGERIDNRYKVTDETAEAIKIEYIKD